MGAAESSLTSYRINGENRRSTICFADTRDFISNLSQANTKECSPSHGDIHFDKCSASQDENQTYQTLEQYGLNYQLFPVIKYPSEVLYPLPRSTFVAQHLDIGQFESEEENENRIGARGNKKFSTSTDQVHGGKVCRTGTGSFDLDINQVKGHKRKYSLSRRTQIPLGVPEISLNLRGDYTKGSTVTERVDKGKPHGEWDIRQEVASMAHKKEIRFPVKSYEPCQIGCTYISICGRSISRNSSMNDNLKDENATNQTLVFNRTSLLPLRAADLKAAHNPNRPWYVRQYKAVTKTLKLTIDKALKLHLSTMNRGFLATKFDDSCQRKGLYVFARDHSDQVCRAPVNFANVATSLNPFFGNMISPHANYNVNNIDNRCSAMSGNQSQRHFCMPRTKNTSPALPHNSQFPLSPPFVTPSNSFPLHGLNSIPIGSGQLLSLHNSLCNRPSGPQNMPSTNCTVIPRILSPGNAALSSVVPCSQSGSLNACNIDNQMCSPDTIIIRRRRRKVKKQPQQVAPVCCWPREQAPITFQSCPPRIVEQIIPPDKVIYEQVQVGYKTERTIIQPPLQQVCIPIKKFMVVDVGKSSDPCSGECTILSAEQVIEMVVCDPGYSVALNGRDGNRYAKPIQLTTSAGLDNLDIQNIIRQAHANGATTTFSANAVEHSADSSDN